MSTGQTERNRHAVLSILFILLLGIITSSYIYFSTITTPAEANCDRELSNQIGSQAICLEPIKMTISSSNASEYNVPVLMMKPGSGASLTILYRNVIKTSPTNVYPQISSDNRPYALAVATGRLVTSGLVFSQGTLVYQNDTWSIYKYSVTASSNSSGYYAVLPPFYYGFYPALVVGSGPLNTTALSMWGFSGIIESGEFILPSTIVGIGNFQLVNATVPATMTCPNTACLVISHSGY